ncbi:GNAT family N-acetyltransferase [Rubrobacter marinus]|uniref:GNAT family N-acetyltransferase n=1 Tax=Rubrobacter marinus TaxID=2653852 RepID=UPI00389B2B49
MIEEDGEPRATATVLPMEAFVDGEPAAMGGIAAVNAHPAYRRRGYAGRLMRAAIDGMRERGMTLSMLHPFAHAFYRAYGWELATEAIKYELSPTEIPTSAEQRRVRAYDPTGGDLSRMAGLFDGWAASRSCSVGRPEGRWLQHLARKNQEAAVYEGEGGTIEGYLLYKQSEGSGDPPNTLDVSELVAATPAAREALVSFMGAYDPRMYTVTLSTPRGEPLHPYLPDSYVKARLEPEFMLRLVDVEGALGLLRRTGNEPIVLEVSDDAVPENSGSYTLADGGVTRGAQAEARVALDVRRLAQLYAGYLPAGQLARYGLIEPGSPEALEVLDAWFPTNDPYVSEPDHF